MKGTLSTCPKLEVHKMTRSEIRLYLYVIVVCTVLYSTVRVHY